MQARSVWNFIAWLSGALALSSAIVTPVVAGFGVQLVLGDIAVAGYTFRLNLVVIGYYIAIVYAIAQVAEALTPPGSSGFQAFARIASRIALVSFAVTLVAMCVQLGVDASNVRELMRQSSPFTLVIGLFLVALADVTVLPWLKRMIYGNAANPVAPNGGTVHHGEVLQAQPGFRPADTSAIIGHMSGGTVNALTIDCRGQDVRILPPLRAGDPPQIEVMTPRESAA